MSIQNEVSSIVVGVVEKKGELITSNDENIFEKGLIDSFSVIELVSALEDHFQLQIPLADLNVQNFGSISKISKFIEKLKFEM